MYPFQADRRHLIHPETPLNSPRLHEILPGNVQVLRWPHARPLPEGEVQAFFSARGLKFTRWSNPPGDRYAAHSHAYRKMLFCVAGGITFALTDLEREVTLRPGDRLTIPEGVRHSARVGEEGVTCIEAGEV